MARKRRADMAGGISDDDASYQPKRTKTRDDGDAQLKPLSRKSKGKGKKNRDIPDSDAESAVEFEATSVEALASGPHPASLHVISRPGPLREALLKWYEGVHASRGMPWRKPYDPSWDMEQKAQRAYEVWVSEIMLQQTQVATVIPYYNKWIERFPTIRDLAASDIEVVNSLWKGLGYYSRAARLLSGAQKAVEEFGGRLPYNAQDMESKVPGIGRYSAGAICSIAYNQCVPVLDGNVHRLLSRLLAVHAQPKMKQTLDVLWTGASAFVQDADHPGDINQALIELGSTVCKVREPSCSACPLQRWCVAYQHQEDHGEEDEGPNYATSRPARNRAVPDIEELCMLCEPLPSRSPVTAYPMKVEKKKAREELDIVNVIEWRKGPRGPRWFLLVRRPKGGLLAGLHEFPTAPNLPVTTKSSAQIAIADTLLSALLISPPTRSLQTSERSEEHTKGSRRHAVKPTGCSEDLQIEKIVPAGDVLHIFSHIKKTYRVQWILLGGGTSDDPPPLVRNPDTLSFGTAQPNTSTDKTSKKGRTGTSVANFTHKSQSSPGSGPTTQWVQLDAVADANIGMGVLKVWRQVRALWSEDDQDKLQSG